MKEWLDFVLKSVSPSSKTKIYSVIPKVIRIPFRFEEDELGEIKWYPQWRHYCFFPTTKFEAVYSDGCLLEISNFITKLSELPPYK